MYSGASPILGNGTASADDIDRWFAAKGPAYASYAPDNAYKAAPAIGASIVGQASAWGVNSDLAAAQMLLESAAFQSAICRDFNNPSGYGATNDDPYGKATHFDTPASGIRATIAHLCSYTRGHGVWDQYDPRQSNISIAGWLGVCRVLNDLNGRWAFPGTTYGAGIAALANDLVTFAQQTGGAMAGDDQRFAYRPDDSEYGYPQGQKGRAGFTLELAVLHFTAGTDSLQWLLDNHGSSSHYLTHHDGTPRAQMIPEADAAWTGGSREYNCRGIHLEHEKLSTDPWPDAVVRELARTWAPIATRNNIPAVYLGRDNAQGKRGFIGHRDIPDGSGGWGGSDHHSDPGGPPDGGPVFPWDTFIGYLKAEMVGSVVIPPDPAPSGDALVLPGSSVPIVAGFREFLLTLAAARYPQDTNAAILSMIGLPSAPEFTSATGSVQIFERGVLLWTRGANPPFDIVLKRSDDAIPEAT